MCTTKEGVLPLIWRYKYTIFRGCNNYLCLFITCGGFSLYADEASQRLRSQAKRGSCTQTCSVQRFFANTLDNIMAY